MTDQQRQTEPWLRGTLSEAPAVVRAVLHALELARQDVTHWCRGLTGLEVNARPMELPSIAFHVQHICGSLDRLLTYAEGKQLGPEQLGALKRESESSGIMAHVLLRNFERAIEDASRRVRAFAGCDLEQPRNVGRQQLPTTVGGLLVHIADHTQRHVGQAITTAKVVMASRYAPSGRVEDS